MIAPPSREKIFKEIINFIDYNKSPYIHIFAGSKMGKTTILYNLKEYFLTQKHLIVVYYRFGSENLLPFNEWLNSIINNKFENYKAHIDSENPSYRFIQILKKLKDPNFVDSTINVIFLLDDLHKINRLPDFSSYYNFFGRLSDDSSINNFKIIATTVRNYSERNHGGSLFFLKCNYTTTLYPFTKEDLRILFNDVSDNLIDIIKRKTGGHPQLVFQLLNLIGTNSDNEIYDLSQDNIWENLSQLINLETYLRSLNEEEIELLLIIVDKLDFNNSVSISKINSTQINNKILKRNINNLKNYE